MMGTQSVFVVGRSRRGRQLARHLATTAGLEIVEPGAASDLPRAALLFLPSPARLEEAKRLVRKLAPTPIVALANDCGEGTCLQLRAVGLAGCVPLSADETRTAHSLSAALTALGEGSAPPCLLCPLRPQGEDAALWTDSPPDLRTLEWTGHDTGGALCFPFIASSPPMRDLARMAGRVAQSDATVLITGESGTGKEVLARFIHRHGARVGAPFVKVNCATLPEPLLESELFGYEKGAFTGADGRKPGRFETADGGIVFLDEISEMSLGLQAKLLQVLEAKRFQRLGGLKDVTVDVQIIAATNRDIEKEVLAGRFREDLFFRLRVIELRVPPLRQRRVDIPLLVNYFLCRLSHQHSRPMPIASPALMELFREAPWTGNVRELENALRRLVILGEEDPLLEELQRERGSGVTRAEATRGSPSTRGSLNLKDIARQAAREAEKEAILVALNQTRWNRSRAARLLGVSYKTLLTKMKELLPPGAEPT